MQIGTLLLLLHRTLILPKLEYGCEVYSSATEAHLRVLDSVYHAGIRLATGAFRSSPIPSLLVDAGLLPLDVRRQSSLLRCWFRTQRLPESVPCRSILRDSRSPAYATRPSLPKPLGFGLRLSCRRCRFLLLPSALIGCQRLGTGSFPVCSCVPLFSRVRRICRHMCCF